MKVTVNGKNHELKPRSSLADLVQLLDLQGKRLAIEVNQEIVPRGQYPSFELAELDHVEIVHAIGGG